MKMIVFILFCLPLISWANFTDSPAQGFHWYRLDHDKATSSQPRRVTVSGIVDTQTLSPSAQLHALTQVTRNTMATALLHPTVENTAHYMRAQQFWAQQDQRFVRSWQQALLKYPELDYSLHFPTDNNAIPVRNDEHKALVVNTLKTLPKHYGLLFFYRGGSSVCQKFASILLPFVQQYHFSMISITTDGQPIIGLPHPKAVPIALIQRVMDLRSRYLPALFLVNLRTHQMQALSYGFISISDLQDRFLDVLTHFKRLSFNGLGERIS